MPRKPKSQLPPEENNLYEDAIFGEVIENFLRENEIGKYLTVGLGELRQEKLESLATIDFSKQTDIVRIQASIEILDQINGLLVEAVEKGRQAKQLLEDAHGN